MNDYSGENDDSNDMSKYVKKCASLDENHTHFVLVDNTVLNQFDGEIKFRSELQQTISDLAAAAGDGDDSKVPVVVLVVEGGPNTMKTCYESVVKSKTPCLFIEVKPK
jgi:hypothetical protein